ncbi:MAG: META domain-containing protein [Rhodobacteraceae bacterium]|nr:MAG: META domain-containing protein [Paracoccaceae bacterium]
MFRVILSLSLLLMTACRGDETIAAYGADDMEWQLTELDGQPFAATATLRFPEPGRLTGAAPCNSYSAVLDAPYPWFDAQNLSVTRMVCEDQKAENQYLQALQGMTLSEVSGGTLILSNDGGREMLFTAAE